MSKASRPTLLTAVLSAASLVGYLGYRLLLDDAADERSPADAAEQPALAAQLPSFLLDDLDGSPTSIESWPGEPLLVNFWATWCAPCLREIPLLKAFQTDHPDVRVVGIAVDRFEPVVSFAAEMDFNYPILVGQGDAMDAAAQFGVDVFALPFTVFTAASGSVLGVRTGEIHPEHLENYLAVLADLDTEAIGLDVARARIAGLR